MTISRPLVSVIIPVYNTGCYIGECLDSIAGQTHRDIEVIIVDDGSTDNSPEICNGFVRRDSRFRLISQPNSGQSVARNTGLDAATGEYIMFMDSDDVAHRSLIERLIEMAISSGAEIASVGFRYFSGATPAINDFLPKPVKVVDSGEAVSRLLYQTGINSGVWGKLFVKHHIDQYRFEPGMLYEDLEFMPRITAGVSRFAYSADRIYYYRQHAGSSIGSFHPRRLDALKAVDMIRQWIGRNRPELIKAALDRQLSANFNMLALLTRNGLPDSDEAARCWATISQLRATSLINPKVRLKNKAGIIASYLGRRLFQAICRTVPL
ncbi:MAG: glycosyltransferase [Muribaculaceae bacterium]|nr:glycosyltransferase [Muribaculaceae bacterium]